jgi:phage terminase large subunit-like protein
MTNSIPLSLTSLQKSLNVLQEVKAQRLTEDKLRHYSPYPKQAQFHAAGKNHRERLLMAGNQTGKTWAAAMELAVHATGLYPKWWKGHRFDHPIRAWACGETSEVVRATIQLLLLGEPGQYGSGCIPKAALLDVTPARGLADLVDTIRAQHISGGTSTIALKAYSQGRERFQGATIDYIWFDEEPDADIFSEGLTRTNVSKGPCALTFTPLKGVSTVVKRFLHESSPDRNITTMTLDDAKHYSKKQREQILQQYPEHERATRTRGVPAMGSGAAFLVDPADLLVEPFPCPSHWPRLGGNDFGWDHPSAFVELWHDRDMDCLYLVRTLRVRHKTPMEQVAMVRNWRVRWFWPHDGRNQTLAGAGLSLAQQYIDAGLELWREHATFADGGISVEAGVQELHDRMKGDRFKVFNVGNEAFIEEIGLYHRVNGLLIKESDDCISAVRYAMMMRRHGRTDASRSNFNREIKYPKTGFA